MYRLRYDKSDTIISVINHYFATEVGRKMILRQYAIYHIALYYDIFKNQLTVVAVTLKDISNMYIKYCLW